MFRMMGIAAIGTALAAAAYAQDVHSGPTTRAIAEDYLAAYSIKDWDAVREYYSESAVFIDPTSLELGFNNPIQWTGADQIISGIEGWGTSLLQYNVHNVYEASGRVVFQADAVVTYAKPDGDVVMNYPITTIITVTDGHVTEHRDYTDFAGASRVEEN